MEEQSDVGGRLGAHSTNLEHALTLSARRNLPRPPSRQTVYSSSLSPGGRDSPKMRFASDSSSSVTSLIS